MVLTPRDFDIAITGSGVDAVNERITLGQATFTTFAWRLPVGGGVVAGVVVPRGGASALRMRADVFSATAVPARIFGDVIVNRPGQALGSSRTAIEFTDPVSLPANQVFTVEATLPQTFQEGDFLLVEVTNPNLTGTNPYHFLGATVEFE